MDPERVRARKADYDGVVKRIRQSLGGFELIPIAKSALEVTAEEREREFDRMWDVGGFAFWLANYQDMMPNEEANELCADYVRRKIRKIVKDPDIAERLIPKGYPCGTKRPPLDSNYYETFNKDSVLLVDANTDGPIEEITENGIRAGGKEYEFDIIVFATGFDAMTGALKALNLKAAAAASSIRVDRWPAHLSRSLDCRLSQSVHDHRPAKPLGIVEHAGIDRAACGVDQRLHRQHARDRQTIIEATSEAQEQWVAHVNEVVNATLMPRANSWYMGANIVGKSRAFLPYLGPEGVGGYRKKCDEVAANGYEGFELA